MKTFCARSCSTCWFREGNGTLSGKPSLLRFIQSLKGLQPNIKVNNLVFQIQHVQSISQTPERSKLIMLQAFCVHWHSPGFWDVATIILYYRLFGACTRHGTARHRFHAISLGFLRICVHLRLKNLSFLSSSAFICVHLPPNDQTL